MRVALPGFAQGWVVESDVSEKHSRLFLPELNCVSD